MVKGVILNCDQVSEFFIITGIGGQQKMTFFLQKGMVYRTSVTTFGVAMSSFRI